MPVLFLDTGMLPFGQTLDYRKRQLAASLLGLTTACATLRPTCTRTWPPATPKPSSGRPTPTACCRNDPQGAAAGPRPSPSSTPWLTRPQAVPRRGSRLSLPVVEQAENGQLKFNPLANWTKLDLDAYAAEHDLPAHRAGRPGLPLDRLLALHQSGGRGPGRARAGRWAGLRTRPNAASMSPARPARWKTSAATFPTPGSNPGI